MAPEQGSLLSLTGAAAISAGKCGSPGPCFWFPEPPSFTLCRGIFHQLGEALFALPAWCRGDLSSPRARPRHSHGIVLPGSAREQRPASPINSSSPRPFPNLPGARGPSHSVFLSRSRKQEPFVASPAGASQLGLQRVLFSLLFTVLLWAVRFPHRGKACKWGWGGGESARRGYGQRRGAQGAQTWPLSQPRGCVAHKSAPGR